MKNIFQASGGDWGGTKVDEAYEKFLEGILGKETIDEFKRSHMDDYIYMIREFELKKRNVYSSESIKLVVFRVPAMLPKLVKRIKGKKIIDLIKDSPFGNPIYVTDEGCHLAGTLNVPIEGRGLDRKVLVQMIYWGTEIIVIAVEAATEKVHRVKVDFLG
ncbi:hypothetical protein MAR_012911 [Mya arenaria]|uniref:Uncharacterized protein n=1 Tax=Mya arenaria TaxID=6604 RepID=A0ABY7G1P4_MYAAR|nr:hypothetical protein MAR_012911 [Mya arenaria]